MKDLQKEKRNGALVNNGRRRLTFRIRRQIIQNIEPDFVERKKDVL